MALRFKNILFFIFIQWTAISPSYSACFDHLKEDFSQPSLAVETGTIDTYHSENEFAVYDDKNVYQFSGELSEDGRLKIFAHLVYPDHKKRSHMKGHELYKHMMEHLGVSRIKVIEGEWVEGTNFDQFLVFIKNNPNKSMEEAAASTWSGKQAAIYGFTKVQNVRVKKGSGGQIISINAQFARPN